MSSIGTGYDLAASTFSPDGRIFQVEYAQKAVDNGGTVVALKGKDGVVFAIEKLIPNKLISQDSNRRIVNVTPGIGMAIAGIYPDGKQLARWCQGEAEDYYDVHRSAIPLNHLVHPLSDYVHKYTLTILRPFGCALMLGSWDKKNGSSLYMVEPSGQSFAYKGWALGKHRQAAKTEIEKLNLSSLGMEELVNEAARIIYAVRDETKDKNWKMEMGWASETTRGLFSLLPPKRVSDAETYAKTKLEDRDSDEEMQ